MGDPISYQLGLLKTNVDTVLIMYQDHLHIGIQDRGGRCQGLGN